MRTLIILVSIALSPLVSIAADPLIGQKVFVKEGVLEKVQRTVVGDRKIPIPATVCDVNGEWLWLEKVWILKTDVMSAQEALDFYSEQIELNPTRSAFWGHRGSVWSEKGEIDNAIKDYLEAIRLDPKNPAFHQSIAWIRATTPDNRRRDGNEAVKYATKACELTSWRSASEFGTLAAAYAEAGDFTNAVKWGEKATDIAPADKRQAAFERLKLYRAKMPYREEVKKSAE